MTTSLSPAYAAKLANARREIAELLEQWGCPASEVRAGQVLDALQALGWSPPRAADDTPPPRASYSTREGRDRAKQLLADALAARAHDTPPHHPTNANPHPQVKL